MVGHSRKLFSSLFLSNFVLAGVLLIGLGWYTLDALRDVYKLAWVRHVEQSLDFAQGRCASLDRSANRDSVLESEFRQFRTSMSLRVTLMDTSGIVRFDTDTTAGTMTNHRDRPEFIAAMQSRQGESTRYSATLSKTFLYVARRIDVGHQPMILRISTPIHGLEEEIQKVYRKWAGAIALAMLLAAILAYGMSKRIVAPIVALREGAERFAEGKLDRKIPLSSLSEVHSLAESMNRMAEQLDERIRSIALQKNETEAILSSLVEGVVALDHKLVILRCNQAFQGLFELKGRQVIGRKLIEVVRNSELDSLLSEPSEASRSFVHDISVIEEGGGTRTLLVRASGLRDSDGKEIGTLLVLNDVTRIRKLEEMRSDFVANVSHELKTPITSIKGYVETLQGMPILDDPDAARFLDTVARHADRLNMIVDDLLTLSRIEQDGASPEAEFDVIEVGDLVESVFQSVESTAEKKHLTLFTDAKQGQTLRGNPGLLEQALLNLVTNACKYSDEGKTVSVLVEDRDKELRIRVQDYGFGIEKRHLPRIFERFYRVDKARSRSLGGTGLGLAIAKHITLLHQGRIEVESEVGVGSTFSLVFPK